MLQAIVYSRATGRVRRVLDPEDEAARSEDLLAIIALGRGEGVVFRQKRGRNRLPGESAAHYAANGGDRLHEWQAAASIASGKIPRDLHPDVLEHVHGAAKDAGVSLVEVEDRHEVVDAYGRVAEHRHVDPKCGDKIDGHTLRLVKP